MLTVRSSVRDPTKDTLLAAKQALRKEAELIATDSKDNYVPVDLGTLKGSCLVEDVEETSQGLSVTIAYGGAASAYALAVHEHLSRHSPPSWIIHERARSDLKTGNLRSGVRTSGKVQFGPPGGKGRGPKYLERPLKDAMTGMTDRIAVAVRKALHDQSVTDQDTNAAPE